MLGRVNTDGHAGIYTQKELINDFIYLYSYYLYTCSYFL